MPPCLFQSIPMGYRCTFHCVNSAFMRTNDISSTSMVVQSRRIFGSIIVFTTFERLYLRCEMRRNYERNFTHIHFELRVTFWTSIYATPSAQQNIIKPPAAPLLSPITSLLVYATAVHLRHISALHDVFRRFSPILAYFALHLFRTG